MIIAPWKLRRLGVVGINSRNAEYIMRYNPRRLYPLVDDKLRTKQLALQNAIAVPPLFSVVEIEHQLLSLDDCIAGRTEFVIKPAQGSGGNGVLVITGKVGRNYRKASGELVSADFIAHHISNILNGIYSLGGVTDKAMLEYLVRNHPLFDDLSYQGVPDIRVVVFRGIPVTAMVRLPTSKSQGKANLHQGAIGVGIDLASGRTTGGVHHNQSITRHPDTDIDITGITIPDWEKILTLAASCADMVGLGYLGVDIVLDKELGPLVLELNARPGLNVQLASGFGLANSLTCVEQLEDIPAAPQARVAFAQRGFNQDQARKALS